MSFKTSAIVKLSMFLLVSLGFLLVFNDKQMSAENSDTPKISQAMPEIKDDADWKSKDDAYWKEKLTPEQFHVARKAGTEMPFSGQYYKDKREGAYLCSSCGLELFASDTKYDSGTGWPSFTDPVNTKNVRLIPDNSKGMQRTEVVCARCSAHLGHVFDDGPSESGNRFCINSLSLIHEKDKAE